LWIILAILKTKLLRSTDRTAAAMCKLLSIVENDENFQSPYLEHFRETRFEKNLKNPENINRLTLKLAESTEILMADTECVYRT
jgi:hypothetical protein